MTIVDTFPEFVAAAAEYADADGRLAGQRVGQRVFNLLAKVKPDVAVLVKGSDFDPFNDDARLPLFYDYILRHWDDDRRGF